jgi:GT2 family glycosyltransferase
MELPAVSIITPTWNRKELLAEAIGSVRCQTATNWEHVIVDDGSSDGSREMVESVCAGDPRVRWLPREGDAKGANVCRNQGIRQSRGEFIVFLDSDDLLDPSCLEKRLVLMQRNPDLDFATYLTGHFVQEVGDRPAQEQEEIFGDDLLGFLYFEHPWIITAPIWRKKSLLKLGVFDESLPSWQDVDLHIRAVCAGLKYIRIPEIDHQVRWLEEDARVSVQQRKSADHLQKALKTFEKFEGSVRNGPGMDWSRQRALCWLYFFVAERWIDRGELLSALHAWRVARIRGLLPLPVFVSGAGLLALKRITGNSELVRRLINKWVGFVRMRTNAELVSAE